MYNVYNSSTDSFEDLTYFLSTNGLLSSNWQGKVPNEISKLKVQNSQLTRLVMAQDEVITLQKQEINLYRKLIEQIMRNKTSANCIAKKQDSKRQITFP